MLNKVEVRLLSSLLLAAALVVVGLCRAEASAQVITGQISGTVKDASGAALPGEIGRAHV